MDAIRSALPGAVLAALRRWHTGPQETLPWAEMLIVAQRRSPSPRQTELAVKEVLLEGLEALDEHAASESAQILRLRFLDALTAAETANRLNLTQDVVYKRQRTAIQDLADAIWQAELDARSTRERRIAARLDAREPARLFGVQDKLAGLLSVLTAETAPWVVAVVGIGGIGKTSLADAAVRVLARRPRFADIAWVGARQERFTLWDGLQPHGEGTPALTAEGLVGAVIEQLGFQDLSLLPQAGKLDGLRARLKALPYLIIVDNLETAADHQNLVPELRDLVNPTRFLLTSRHSLQGYPGVHCVSLNELSAEDSLALLRHEAGERGQADVAAAPDAKLLQVYEVAGGNPLALKLLVGQMQFLSLSRVVDDLREARGRKVEELYRFIYWRSWQLLGHEARRVLAVMPMVAESGGGLNQITVLSELSDEQMMDGLQQLASLCLVNVLGTLEERRYSIHRLTETFLLTEVLRWSATS